MLATRAAKRQRLAVVALTCASLIFVGVARGQPADDTFHWEGNVASGRTVIIRNLNGDVRVESASGRSVTIDARKSWRRGDPRKVRIEARTEANGNVLACALWNERATCDEDGYHNDSRGSRTNESNDVSVTFVVRVPSGVSVDLNTVNGDLRIRGATARVAAHTVNGSIDAASSGGPVRAGTVNGSIVAAMGSAGNEDLSYSTVNGSITVSVPRSLSAELRMSTVNGSIESDFPLTVTGRINRRRVNATVGDGGRTLSFKSVNGDIRLRQGDGDD